MKNNLQKFLAFGFLLFAALGCSAINQVRKEIDKTQQPQIITSVDAKTQITVPGTWKKETNLNEAATLQVSNAFQQLYLVVMTQTKEDVTEEVTLDKLTEISREDITGNVSNAQIGETVPLTINGYPARQFEISGTVEGFKAKYIYTVVEAPADFYQIAAWTLASRFESNKAELQEVINSFKETGISNGDLPPPAPAEPPKPGKK